MGSKFIVLDHGYVELIDSMGDDNRVIEAARVCVDKSDPVTDAQKYISALWNNKHTTPFEQVVFTFKVKCPIFVARQWLRYRTARVNELSMRRAKDNLEFYTPPNNRLGEDYEMASLNIKNAIVYTEEIYRCLLNQNVPAEIARIILPVNLYTTFIWQMDLHNLLNFLQQRLSLRAQWEIMQYAKQIKEIVKRIVPLSVAAAFKEDEE